MGACVGHRHFLFYVNCLGVFLQDNLFYFSTRRIIGRVFLIHILFNELITHSYQSLFISICNFGSLCVNFAYSGRSSVMRILFCAIVFVLANKMT